MRRSDDSLGSGPARARTEPTFQVDPSRRRSSVTVLHPLAPLPTLPAARPTAQIETATRPGLRPVAWYPIRADLETAGAPPKVARTRSASIAYVRSSDARAAGSAQRSSMAS